MNKGFTLSATATGSMSGDDCTTFTLSHTGAKGFTGSGSQDQSW